MADPETLILQLSRAARPVRRPWPSAWRAFGWAVLALPAGLLAPLALRTHATDWTQPGALWAALATVLSFLLGLGAMIAALAISIAGRQARAGGWFGAGVAAWLVANAGAMLASPHPVGRLGEGRYCYIFMLLASLPMIPLAILWLRRTRAVDPARSLALAGLGIGFMAMTLLGFCHPTSGELADFLGHLLAGATIVGLTILCGRRWIAI